jgi:hypothetical protein
MFMNLLYHYFCVILKAMKVFQNHHTFILIEDVFFQVHSIYLFGHRSHQFSFITVLTPS